MKKKNQKNFQHIQNYDYEDPYQFTKTDTEKVYNMFFDENHHMDSTKAQDYSRISQTNHLTPIRDTFQKLGFPETSTALTMFEQSPTQHRF